MSYYLYDGRSWEKVGNKFSNAEEIISECKATGIHGIYVGQIEEYNSKDCYMFFDRNSLKFKKEKILKLFDDKEFAQSQYVLTCPPTEMDEETKREIEHDKEIDAFFSGADDGCTIKEIATVVEDKKSKKEVEESSSEELTSSEEKSGKKKRGRPKKMVGTTSLL